MIYIFSRPFFRGEKGGIVTIPAPPIYESRQEVSHRICGSLCIASLGGPPIGGQDRDGASYRCSAPYTLSRFAGLPLKGKRENR